MGISSDCDAVSGVECVVFGDEWGSLLDGEVALSKGIR